MNNTTTKSYEQRRKAPRIYGWEIKAFRYQAGPLKTHIWAKQIPNLSDYYSLDDPSIRYIALYRNTREVTRVSREEASA